MLTLRASDANQLFNCEKRNRRYKFIDGEFTVDDQGTIRTEDLRKVCASLFSVHCRIGRPQ